MSCKKWRFFDNHDWQVDYLEHKWTREPDNRVTGLRVCRRCGLMQRKGFLLGMGESTWTSHDVTTVESYQHKLREARAWYDNYLHEQQLKKREKMKALKELVK